MDPQRQYAQLLTLWSQGSKMFRRDRYLDKRRLAAWEVWWRLGRRMAERRMTVLPVPLEVPSLLVGTEDIWFTVCPESWAMRGVAKKPLVGVRDTPGNALEWHDSHWTVCWEIALALGARGWTVLAVGGRPDGTVVCPSPSEALTLIGALSRKAEIFRTLPADEWLVASQLLRHPNRRMPAAHPLPERWGFRFDDASNEVWWDRQDEDSVHER